MRVRRVLAVLFVALGVVCGLLSPAGATHQRYGTSTWTPASPGSLTTTFNIQHAVRRTSQNCVNPADLSVVPCSAADGYPTTGEHYAELSYGFGDGSWVTPAFQVTSFDVNEDYVFGQATVQHTYAAAGSYLMSTETCCRISTLMNNADGSYRVETSVVVGGSNRPPVTSLPPIVDCLEGSVCSFAVQASDADGDPLRWRFSTDVEASGSSGGFQQPPGATIDATTGQYTFDTASVPLAGSGSTLYSTQVAVEDLDGAGVVKTKVVVDFLIRLVDTIVPPAQFVTPTPACGSTMDAPIGAATTFDVRAVHADTSTQVNLNVTGLPVGATMTPALPADGNPVQSTFSWTPTAAQEGDYVTNFIATVPGGQQALCTFTIRVTEDEPLTILKVADQPSTVTNGDVGYTITVTNPNSGAAQIDSISDTLPAGFSYRPGTTTGATTADPSISGQTLTWAGPFTVPGDGELALHLGARAPSTAGTYFNEASFTIDTEVTPTGPTAPITVSGTAVHVTKTADDSLVQRGAATGYTITVVNGGTTDLALDSIIDTLPPGFSYRAGTSSGLTTANPAVNGRTLTWTGSFAVPAGASRALHFGVKAATLAGDYFNEAGASATNVPIQPTGPTARITVVDHLRTTKTANPQQIQPGGSVSYTITLTNPLSSAKTVTSITDTLPSGFTYKAGTTSGVTTANPSINGRVLTWTGSWSVPAGGQRTLTFAVTAPSVAGTYLNEATALASGVTVKPTGPTAAVVVLSALSTSKVADVSTVVPGGAVGYTITVTNSNSTSHTLSAITDTLPAGFSYIANSTSGVTTANPTISGGTLRWPGAFFIPAGGSASLHFLARAASTPGEYFNNASASAGVATVLPSGPTARVVVALPMTLTAAADRSPVRINALAPHTITIVNPNSAPAPLVFSAQLPAGFTYVAGTTTGLTTDDPVQAGSVVTWGSGDGLEVAPFSTATLRYVVRASSTPGSYVTHVTAAPGTGDEIEDTTGGPGVLSATAPIVVNAATGLTAAPALAQIKAGSPTVNLTLSATLRVANSTRPVAGKRITFKSFGLTVCSAVTNAQGVATCGGVIGAAQAVLGLGYRAVFAGDAHYLASSAPGDLVVVGSTRI